MTEKELKRSLKALEPSPGQRERMLLEIRRKEKSSAVKPFPVRRTAAAAICCLLVGAGAWISLPYLSHVDASGTITQVQGDAKPSLRAFSVTAALPKYFNFNGYRYTFLGDGAEFTFSNLPLETSLGTLESQIQADPVSGTVQNGEADLASTFAVGGSLYPVPGYSKGFRLAVLRDFKTYLAEITSYADGSPVSPKEFCEVSKLSKKATGATVTGPLGDTLASVGRGQAKQLVELLKKAEFLTEPVVPLEKEPICSLKFQMPDSTSVSLQLFPLQGIVVIGESYYQLPDGFQQIFGDLTFG